MFGVLGVAVLSAGCSDYRTQRVAASPSASFAAPPAGLSTICVFRPHGLGSSVTAPVSDNGTIVGATDDASYFCYQAEPGPHRIRTADAPPLSIDAKEGRSYFLAHDLNVGPDTLLRVTRGSAEALTAWCGEIELRAAPQGVAIFKRGDVARADFPRRLVVRADVKPPARKPGALAAKAAESKP